MRTIRLLLRFILTGVLAFTLAFLITAPCAVMVLFPAVYFFASWYVSARQWAYAGRWACFLAWLCICLPGALVTSRIGVSYSPADIDIAPSP